jgi:hypothetical protein
MKFNKIATYQCDFVWPASGAFENFLDHRHVMEITISVRRCNDVVFKLGYIWRRLQLEGWSMLTKCGFLAVSANPVGQ